MRDRDTYDVNRRRKNLRLYFSCHSHSSSWSSWAVVPLSLSLYRNMRTMGNIPHNFEVWSSEEDDTGVGKPSLSFHTILNLNRFYVHLSNLHGGSSVVPGVVAVNNLGPNRAFGVKEGLSQGGLAEAK
ncbi:hypothetical protein TNCV_2612611 [Trichonephila clavipes]|nr:hypothetical protein TNCV_2612611 [Trichonephila clavipes]